MGWFVANREVTESSDGTVLDYLARKVLWLGDEGIGKMAVDGLEGSLFLELVLAYPLIHGF